MKYRDIIREVEALGWIQVTQRGSHRQYKHQELAGRVTIAGHPHEDVPPGTLKNIRKQARGTPREGA